jgi:hypothetical protein
MYSDLFEALAGGGGSGGGNSSRNNNVNTNEEDENKPVLSFKAGKMDLTWQEPTGTFLVTPDTRRCQVNLMYNIHDAQLEWQWYDRRDKHVVDTIRITNPVLLKPVTVPKSQDADQHDRVYYWKLDSEWKMLWLQEKDIDADLVIEQANAILQVPNGNNNDTTNGNNRQLESDDRDSPNRGTSSSPGVASISSVSTTTRQVDALSSILENLGMPQGSSSVVDSAGAATAAGDGGRDQAAGGGGRDQEPSTTSSGGIATTSANAPSTNASGGTLTLADLQNAMGGMPQLPQPYSFSSNTYHTDPTLSEIVTSDVITNLLLADATVRQRLLEQLPEEQRSEEFLEENLRSPQIQQTLRSLTSALMPDDHGSMDTYHSVLANFQLDAANGQQALATGQSPVQAFLDCILASVTKEQADGAAAADATATDGKEEGADATKAAAADDDDDDEEMNG